MIVCSNLSKVYDLGKTNVTALRGVNLEIGRGEFVAVMGPSGSGKSTLLNILGCLDSPTSGSYTFNQKNMSALTIREKALLRNEAFGFVFQEFHLLADLTVLDNVLLPLKYSRVPKKEWRSRAQLALELVGIGGLSNRYPDELSGGQKQRTAIARALVNNPEVILADEPTGNLDRETGAEMMKTLKELWHETNTTIITVTHDAQVASAAGRVLQIVDGRIVDDISMPQARVALSNPFFAEVEEEEG